MSIFNTFLKSPIYTEIMAHRKSMYENKNVIKYQSSTQLMYYISSRNIIVRWPFREEHLAVCRKYFLYTYHFGEYVPTTSHSVTSPPLLVAYLSNRCRYRLDLGLIGKVFESTFQILKNGISMVTSLATRCKTP